MEKKPRKKSAAKAIPKAYIKKKRIDRQNKTYGHQPWYSIVKNPTGPMPAYTPDTLWAKFIDYMEWNEKNPLMEAEARAVSNGMNMGSDIEIISIPKMRAMTIRGFCMYAGVVFDTFMKWRRGDLQQGNLKYVCEVISDIIHTQKFEGAAAGLLNALIISRDLGLVDKTLNENITATSVPLNKEDIIEISKRLDEKF